MTPLGRGARVVTGATGFVGSHFLRSWAARGERVLALARPDTGSSAADRVRLSLSRAAESLAAPAAVPSVRTLAGDLREPSCGVSGSGLVELRGLAPSELWHFAASLQYEDRHRAAIHAVNVDGTRRALELACAIGAEWFVYVSTAYTAGKQRGAIALELPSNEVEHNNCYEASKAEAERLVVDFCAQHGLRYAILRPSIVIGPYCSKSTGGSSTGLYGFVREIARARSALCNLGRPLQLRGEPRTELNLLPIDWFGEDVDELLRSEPRESCIHHHTLDAPPTIGDIAQALTELLALPGFAISPSFAAPSSPLEQLLARRTAFYGAYLSGTKHFQRARPFPRRLTPGDVREYVAAALGHSEVLARPVVTVEPERRSRVGR